MKYATVALFALQAVGVLASPVAHADELLPRSNDANVLTKRECWTQPQKYGCSKDKYCWVVCDAGRGTGEWCWLAFNGGRGDWVKCENDYNCVDAAGHGSGCAQGDCSACGCSC